MKINKEKISIVRYNLEKGFYVEISLDENFYSVYVSNYDFKVKVRIMSMTKNWLAKSKDFDEFFKTEFTCFDYNYYSELLKAVQDGYNLFNE